MNMFEYIMIKEQLVSPYLGSYQTFGIAAFKVEQGQRKEVARLSDISTDREFVSQLAVRCTAAQLHPLHLKDVAQDALAAL